jgi:hypothetical protein
VSLHVVVLRVEESEDLREWHDGGAAVPGGAAAGAVLVLALGAPVLRDVFVLSAVLGAMDEGERGPLAVVVLVTTVAVMVTGELALLELVSAALAALALRTRQPLPKAQLPSDPHVTSLALAKAVRWASIKSLRTGYQHVPGPGAYVEIH